MNTVTKDNASAMQVLEFLGRVELARLDYRRGVQRVETLQERFREVSESWGRAEAFEDGLLESLVRARGELPGLYRAWERAEEEAEAFLDGVEDVRLRMILKLRYVDLKTWPKVMEELERSGIYYEQRHVFNLHTKALAAAQALWERQQGGACPDAGVLL